ncbi:P-loop containing nucleoside triphosphate hydrolase protein [Pavlovales sp. CCMP2436]|nr:P-loop containing nucleoside triphosphate hydrolase protein [Pavlovales sp. CCMP2436]
MASRDGDDDEEDDEENEEGDGQDDDGRNDGEDDAHDSDGNYDEADIGDDDPSNIDENKETAVRQFLGPQADDKVVGTAVDALMRATGLYAFQSSVQLEVFLHWARVLSGEIDQEAEIPAAVVLPTGSGKSHVIAGIGALMSLRAEVAAGEAEGGEEGEVGAPGLASFPKVLVLSPNKEINKGLKKALVEAVNKAGCKRPICQLSKRRRIGGALYAKAGVVLTNYHILSQGKDDVLQTFQVGLGKFDTIIIDEGHHRAACSYELIIRHFKPKFVLFLSACFLRGDGVEIKCTTVFRRELQWAVDKKLIAEPSIQNLVISNMLLHKFKDGHEESAEERAELKTPKELIALVANPELHEQIAQSMTSQLILMRKQAKTNILVGLVKAANIKQAEGLVKVYGECEYKWTNAAGTSVTRKIRAAMYVAGTRKRYLKIFEKGEIDVLIVVGKLSEGYDFPPISVLAWHYPTTSVLCALQFLGRALRWITPQYNSNQSLDDTAQAFKMDHIWKMIGRTLQIHEVTPLPLRSNKRLRTNANAPSSKPQTHIEMDGAVVSNLVGVRQDSSHPIMENASGVPATEAGKTQARIRARNLVLQQARQGGAGASG